MHAVVAVSPEQELLLDAALCDRDRAVRAWDQWVDRTDFDRVDAGSQRLLPLVHRNLERLGVTTRWSGRLKGLWRRSWYENQLLLDGALRAVDDLTAAGIEVLVLKGAALAVLFYGDLGARPMQDLDVLVPQARAEDALRLLLRDGWEPEHAKRLPEPLGALPPSLQRHIGAVGLVRERHQIDLHWHVCRDCCWDGADQGFWERATRFDLRGRELLTLAPTDHLLHACLHGAPWNPVPSIRWIADAVIVMRTAAIDWPGLVDRVSDLRVQPPMIDALQNLHDRFDAPVPGSVLEQLAAIRPTRLDRWWYEYRRQPRHGRLGPRDVAAEYGRYLRAAPGRGPQRWFGGLPRYLQHLWYLDRPADVPAALALRVARRLPRPRRTAQA